MKHDALNRAAIAIVNNPSTSARPVLQLVHYLSDGGWVVTDSHQLLQFAGDSEVKLDEFNLDPNTLERVFDADYPDTSRLIPSSADFQTTCDFGSETKLFSTIVRSLRAMKKAFSEEPSPVVKCFIEEDRLIFKAYGSHVEVPATFDFQVPVKKLYGEKMVISANPEYLINAFTLFRDCRNINSVKLSFINELRPMVFEQGKITYLVCPVRTF